MKTLTGTAILLAIALAIASFLVPAPASAGVQRTVLVEETGWAH